MSSVSSKKASPGRLVSPQPKTAKELIPTDDHLQTGTIPIAGMSHEEIAKRAYQIYEQQGRPQGQCEQHWLQAEQEQLNLCKRSQGIKVVQEKSVTRRAASTKSHSQKITNENRQAD